MSRQVCACGSAHAGVAFATVEVCAIIERARVVGVLDSSSANWGMVRFAACYPCERRTHGVRLTNGERSMVVWSPVSDAEPEGSADAARAAAAKAIEEGSV